MPRRDQRRWGACYLRGLMLDGRRKSIQRWPSSCRTGTCRLCSSS
nr:transposase [Streptomyces sp. DvalAA-19]